MRSFYHYLLTYRGKKYPDEKAQLADWAFYDHNFPRHSTDYDELSNYLEWNSPFSTALITFDALWDDYSK